MSRISSRLLLGIRKHGHPLTVAVHAPYSIQAHARAQAIGDLVGGQVQRRGKVGIQNDGDFAHVPAEHLDASNASDACERGTHDKLRQVVQLARVDGALQVEGEHGERACGDALDDDFGAVGQRTPSLRYPGFGKL